jgi:hypothetical protein
MRKDYHLLLSAVITYTVISIAFLVWVASA